MKSLTIMITKLIGNRAEKLFSDLRSIFLLRLEFVAGDANHLVAAAESGVSLAWAALVTKTVPAPNILYQCICNMSQLSI